MIANDEKWVARRARTPCYNFMIITEFRMLPFVKKRWRQRLLFLAGWVT
jgi:hypothetical protein